MALTEFQRHVCRLVAQRRIERGDSYVAGATPLNELLRSPRVSRDVDFFHDSTSAVARSFAEDKEHLEAAGLEVQINHERFGHVEAVVRSGSDVVLLEWAADSAFRFFPLVEHADFGLMLHPFDLATNKVLALVGRLEVRDWLDVISCSDLLQPLGYLLWAASGKDPGFAPSALLAHARRSARYTQPEIDTLEFQGAPPSAAEMGQRWHAMLAEAENVHAVLPPETAGACVLDDAGRLFRNTARLEHAVAAGAVVFHHGTLGGVLPFPKD